MTLRRRARADWTGDAHLGAGTVTVDSGAFDPQVITVGSRARELPALTSPEELFAAAQAACLLLTIVTLMEESDTRPPAFSVEACCEVSVEGDRCALRRVRLTACCPPTADAGAFAAIVTAAAERGRVAGIRADVPVSVTVDREE